MQLLSFPQRSDPVLSYSTYLGGPGAEESVNDLKVDSAGNAYVAYDDYDDTGPSHDFVVSKISPTGGNGYTIELGTFHSEESATALTVDASGNAYVTGWAYSYPAGHPRFPTVNALQPEAAGGVDAVVVKLNPQGEVVFATYLGGSGDDYGRDITLDASGNIYVTGTTTSDDFPTRSPYLAQHVPGGNSNTDVFVTKINAAGSVILYSTYFGGNDDDSVAAVAVDASGSIYLAGSTKSPPSTRRTNLLPASVTCSDSASSPTMSACWNGYAVKFNPSGSDLVYSFGWSDPHKNHFVVDAALDGSGSLYIAESGSVRKLNSDGDGLVYSTDIPAGVAAVAVDQNGNAYTNGSTIAADSQKPSAPVKVHVVKLSPDGKRFAFAVELNGTVRDSGHTGSEAGASAGTAIAVTPSGVIYAGGYSESLDFPTTDRSTRSQLTLASTQDAILFVIQPNERGNIGLLTTPAELESSQD
jgi:hypothetical protein